MKQIEDYTQEELVALYKRYSLYATTWYFKYYRTYRMKDNKEALIDRDFKPANSAEWVSYMWHIAEFNIDFQIDDLQNKKTDNKRELSKLKYSKEGIRIIDKSIYWFGGGHEEYVEKYNSAQDSTGWETPEEREEQLHSGDDIHIEYGTATDYQMYQFVWNTLQYLSIPQLGKLLRFADRGIGNNWERVQSLVGRKSKVCEIQQIDIDSGEVVGVYMTRNELIEKTGIKKSHLSQCIKTSKVNPNNRLAWKKWKREDNRLFGFVEVQ